MSNKPIHKVRFGNISVSIWENRTQEGKLFHGFELQRSYMDQHEQWQQHSLSLGLNELAKVKSAVDRAYQDYFLLELNKPSDSDEQPGGV